MNNWQLFSKWETITRSMGGSRECQPVWWCPPALVPRTRSRDIATSTTTTSAVCHISPVILIATSCCIPVVPITKCKWIIVISVFFNEFPQVSNCHQACKPLCEKITLSWCDVKSRILRWEAISMMPPMTCSSRDAFGDTKQWCPVRLKDYTERKYCHRQWADSTEDHTQNMKCWTFLFHQWWHGLSWNMKSVDPWRIAIAEEVTSYERDYYALVPVCVFMRASLRAYPLPIWITIEALPPGVFLWKLGTPFFRFWI